MELAVYNINGEKTSKKAKLNDAIFGIEPNDHVMYMAVRQYMANKRQGTHNTKERNQVVGSTRKIKRQKGTGTARFGDIKNPIFRGGGRTFGPSPRDYNFKLNKKMKRLARLSALSYKAKENGITVLEDFSMEAPKTKDFVDILNKFELQGKKVLIVISKDDNNLNLSARNVQKAKIVRAESINTYDILNANTLLIAEGSLEVIEKIHSVN